MGGMETDLSKCHKGTDGFYYEDYVAPDKAGTFIGRLVCTEWWHKGAHFALICNFKTEDDRRVALFAFQKYTGFYGPRDGAVNFKQVEMNTLWQCEIQKTRTGRCTWMSACQIREPEALRSAPRVSDGGCRTETGRNEGDKENRT